jgi:acyl dehydratase
MTETASLKKALADVSLRTDPISRTDIVRFAGASGDFNPLHHDEQYARAAGFRTVFAMGQLQAGLLSRLVTDWIGLENVLSYRVRFSAKVWPGDELLLRGREDSRAFDSRRGEIVVQCSLEALRGDEEVAIAAAVTAVAR